MSFLPSRMSEETGQPPREVQADYELVVRESTAGGRVGQVSLPSATARATSMTYCP